MKNCGNVIRFPGGLCVIEWTDKETPCINEWYRTREWIVDYWKIMKDRYDMEKHCCLYKIVSYYDADVIENGLAIWQAKQMLKDNTYRSEITDGL